MAAPERTGEQHPEEPWARTGRAVKGPGFGVDRVKTCLALGQGVLWILSYATRMTVRESSNPRRVEQRVAQRHLPIQFVFGC